MMPQGCALYTLYNHNGNLKSILSDLRWARLKNSPTYTDDGISPALPAITSGFGSGFWVVVARQGGSGVRGGGPAPGQGRSPAAEAPSAAESPQSRLAGLRLGNGLTGPPACLLF